MPGWISDELKHTNTKNPLLLSCWASVHQRGYKGAKIDETFFLLKQSLKNTLIIMAKGLISDRCAQIDHFYFISMRSFSELCRFLIMEIERKMECSDGGTTYRINYFRFSYSTASMTNAHRIAMLHFCLSNHERK